MLNMLTAIIGTGLIFIGYYMMDTKDVRYTILIGIVLLFQGILTEIMDTLKNILSELKRKG